MNFKTKIGFPKAQSTPNLKMKNSQLRGTETKNEVFQESDKNAEFLSYCSKNCSESTESSEITCQLYLEDDVKNLTLISCSKKEMNRCFTHFLKTNELNLIASSPVVIDCIHLDGHSTDESQKTTTDDELKQSKEKFHCSSNHDNNTYVRSPAELFSTSSNNFGSLAYMGHSQSQKNQRSIDSTNSLKSDAKSLMADIEQLLELLQKLTDELFSYSCLSETNTEEICSDKKSHSSLNLCKKTKQLTGTNISNNEKLNHLTPKYSSTDLETQVTDSVQALSENTNINTDDYAIKFAKNELKSQINWITYEILHLTKLKSILESNMSDSKEHGTENMKLHTMCHICRPENCQCEVGVSLSTSPRLTCINCKKKTFIIEVDNIERPICTKCYYNDPTYKFRLFHPENPDLNSVRDNNSQDRTNSDSKNMSNGSIIYEVGRKNRMTKNVKYDENQHKLERDKNINEEFALSSVNKNDELSRKNKEKYTVKDYLIMNRPSFYFSAENRRQQILNAKLYREQCKDKMRGRFLKYKCAEDLNNIPEKIFTEKEMKELTRKKYNNLPEVKKKIQIDREKHLRSEYRHIKNIFIKRLQTSVLRGQLNFPTNKTVTY